VTSALEPKSEPSRTVKFSGISIQQYDNGKLIRGWDNWDQLALQQQLSEQAAATA
jgi:predicted ester cyclase